MKKILISSLAFLGSYMLHAEEYRSFDVKSLPLTIYIGSNYDLEVRSLSIDSYPPITTQDLDRGLYIIPQAATVSIASPNPWELFVHKSPSYHEKRSLEFAQARRILWRKHGSNDPFEEVTKAGKRIEKGAPNPEEELLLSYDIAIEAKWGDPPNFSVTTPLIFSVQEIPEGRTP